MDVVLRDTTSLTSAMDVVERVRSLVRDSTIRQLRSASVQVGGYVASLARRSPGRDAPPVPRPDHARPRGHNPHAGHRLCSILVPLKAVLMNSLSVSATFGLIVLVFQYGIGSAAFGLAGATEAIFVLIPVLVFAVVFGLSMDYEVFLLSRIKGRSTGPGGTPGRWRD
ncbi:MAG: hypothetical protein R2882_00370 [Gemmatimonadales bacterium]